MGVSVQPNGPLPRLHIWLSPAGPPHAADLIFVLAGKALRKEYALELLRQDLAPRILFSVGRFEIRRFSKMPLPVPIDLLSLAQALPPPQRHYFVFFDSQTVQSEHVPPKRFGTLNELQSLAAWLARHSHIRSVLIVSSDSHLRRIRMCCQSLLPQSLELSFIAAPQAPDGLSTHISAFKDLQELAKVAVYWILLKLRRK